MEERRKQSGREQEERSREPQETYGGQSWSRSGGAPECVAEQESRASQETRPASKEVFFVNSASAFNMLAQRHRKCALSIPHRSLTGLRNVSCPETIDVALMQAQIGFGGTI